MGAGCLKAVPACLNDRTTADTTACEFRGSTVDLPAECARLIFSLGVISAGGVGESTANQTGTEWKISQAHPHTHVPDKIKGAAQRSVSPALTLPFKSAILF